MAEPKTGPQGSVRQAGGGNLIIPRGSKTGSTTSPGGIGPFGRFRQRLREQPGDPRILPDWLHQMLGGLGAPQQGPPAPDELGGIGADPLDYAKRKPFPSMGDLLRQADILKKASRGRGTPLPPPARPVWTATPTSPFSGLEAHDWKTPGRDPFPIGVVRERPRGNPPGISAREIEQWKLNDRKQLEEMYQRMQFAPSHRNF